MANLLSLKRRIRAAQNVSKTTRAMQMIAISKLKKAQNATLSGRPYVEKLSYVAWNLSSRLDYEHTHEYMKKTDGKNKSLVLVFSPDKGLCGGLVTNLIREIINFDSSHPNSLYITFGKKTESVVANLKKELVASFKFGTTLPSFEMVLPIVKIIDEYFLSQKVSNVKIISTSFLSVFSQKPKITSILPVEFPKEQASISSFTLFEPSPEKLLPPLLRHFLEMTIYQQMLESFASEQGARMVAMQNATDNALEIVQDLKLEYNKGRQEKITNEILDIGGAASAFAYEH
ncbi:MAG: ATP synthase F1 subunit gamma [Candidatus Levybacteria bacterium]|nr:ATP synthase F1 subunit gamma [Candidatus Levybacteria bacterium]